MSRLIVGGGGFGYLSIQSVQESSRHKQKYEETKGLLSITFRPKFCDPIPRSRFDGCLRV